MHKLILIAAAVAIATPALAQQQAQQAPQEITLKVNGDDVNKIGAALGKMPFDEVAPLLQKLRQQIVEQQQQQSSIQNNTGIVTSGQKGDNVVAPQMPERPKPQGGPSVNPTPQPEK